MKAKITLLAVLGIMFFSSSIYAQKELMGSKVVKSRGAVEYTLPTTDVYMQKPVLSRGGCLVKFDNWTGYYVDVWVDKTYKGRLNPYENSQYLLPEGYANVFCRTMGDSFQWQSEGECNDEFELKLEMQDIPQSATSNDDDDF